MNFLHSTIDALRDRYTPVTHTSTFRNTGQVTPEEFIQAGDFLVYKFPSWSWSDASTPSKRVAYLPDNKQFLVTRGVPCRRRLETYESAAAGLGEVTVEKDADGEDEGWLRTGGGEAEAEKDDQDRVKSVRTLDGSGNIRDRDDDDEEEDIPDIEDEEDDEAIIRDGSSSNKGSLRSYSLYITYTPYYRTPRLYLSGYASTSEPLPPAQMMEDIVGDYKDKTVTLEDFPFHDSSQAVKMASVHPCKHASVMKVLLERADTALRLRREKGGAGSASGLEGLVDQMSISSDKDKKKAGHRAGVSAAGGSAGDEWELLSEESGAGSGVGGPGSEEEESAIRVDQYLVVFLKFMASVTPTIEHDFTMSV